MLNKGRYRFNSRINFSVTPITINADFLYKASNDEVFNRLRINKDTYSIEMGNGSSPLKVVYTDGEWKKQAYKEIVIVEDTQVTSILEDFFRANTEYLGEDNNLSIMLYFNNAETNKVDKTANLELYKTLGGTLREKTDIIRPVINIVHKGFIPRVNYAYIPQFNRYYYINNIASINNEIYELSLSVDVLMTYKEDIKKLEAYVTRNEFTFNNLINDEKLPVSYDKIVEEYEVTNGSLATTTLSSNVDINSTSFLVNVINDRGYNDLGSVTPPINQVLPSSVGPHVTGVNMGTHTYATNWTNIRKLLRSVLVDDQQRSYIISIVSLPFPVPIVSSSVFDVTLGTRTYENVKVGDVGNGTSEFFCVGDFTITGNNNFTDYDPYTEYEIYLPYLDWVRFSADVVLNKRLLVFYVIDYSLGGGQVIIVDYTDNKLVYSSSCQIGVTIPISTTNAREVQNNNLINGMSLGINVVGSGLQIASGNPVGVASGVVGLIKGSTNFISGSIRNYQNGHASSGSPSSSVYMPNKIRVRKTKVNINNYDSNYAHLYGKPLNRTKILGDLNGLTIVDSVHIENIPTATFQEISMISSLLREGILL